MARRDESLSTEEQVQRSVARSLGRGLLALLLLVALELLTGKEQTPTAGADVNVALVPLGTPLLAGPGAIVEPWCSPNGCTTGRSSPRSRSA